MKKRAEQSTGRSPWYERRRTVATLLLLTAVAGGLDAITFLYVGGVFVCNQTGNLLFLATSLAGKHQADTGAATCSLVCFVVAAAFGGRLLPKLPPGGRWPAWPSTGSTGSPSATMSTRSAGRRR